MNVTHINFAEAKAVHGRLIEALGTENNPGQWLVFVKLVKELLPFVGRGRPTKSEIENSVIGQYGFSGWGKMVQAPVEDGGFNIPLNTWNKWSQADEFICQYPYLESMNLSQSGVKALKDRFKNVEFPKSVEELEVAEVELKKQKASDEAEKVSSLKSRVLELEQQLVAANAKLDVFAEQNKKSEEQDN